MGLGGQGVLGCIKVGIKIWLGRSAKINLVKLKMSFISTYCFWNTFKLVCFVGDWDGGLGVEPPVRVYEKLVFVTGDIKVR